MSFDKYRERGAYHYQWYGTEDWYTTIIDIAVDFCKGRTLDLGCGDGLLSGLIANKGYEVVGIDTDDEGLRLASEIKPEITFIKHSIYEPIEARYDYLACVNVIEHLRKPQYINKIIRENVAEGAIIITDLYSGGDLGIDHVKEYTLDELYDFFSDFDPLVYEVKGHPFIVAEIYK